MERIADSQSSPRQRSIVDLNNRGIRFLRRYKYEKAVAVFRSTLTSLATSFPEEEETSNCPISVPLEVHAQDLFLEGFVPWSDHNTMILYTCAFSFSLSHERLDPQDMETSPEESSSTTIIPEEAKLISGLVLFNLGLAYHLYTLSQPTTTTQHERDLLRVRKIYSLARQVFERNDLGQLESAQRRVVLATYNNIAHVNVHLLDVEASLYFLGSLGDVMHLYSMGEDQDQQFLLNLLCYAGGKVATTSPAA
ncbi:hypothetical protein ACA910_013827 [Epithemia clementina (nom. ined.)]